MEIKWFQKEYVIFKGGGEDIINLLDSSVNKIFRFQKNESEPAEARQNRTKVEPELVSCLSSKAQQLNVSS